MYVIKPARLKLVELGFSEVFNEFSANQAINVLVCA